MAGLASAVSLCSTNTTSATSQVPLYCGPRAGSWSCVPHMLALETGFEITLTSARGPRQAPLEPRPKPIGRVRSPIQGTTFVELVKRRLRLENIGSDHCAAVLCCRHCPILAGEKIGQRLHLAGARPAFVLRRPRAARLVSSLSSLSVFAFRALP